MTISTRAEALRRVVVGAACLASLAILAVPGVAGADFTTVEGQSFSGPLVVTGGCGAAPGNATIDWGDGTTSPGTRTADGMGVQGTHAYAEEGRFNGTVTYDCPQQSDFPLQAAFQATVGDAPLTSAGQDTAGAVGQPLSAVLAHVADANPIASAGELAAQIVWGDGTTTAGTVIAAAGGGFDITGTHTYGKTGSYPVSTTITDTGGASTSASSTAQIAQTAVPPIHTTITSGPADGSNVYAPPLGIAPRFTFVSSVPGSRFECNLRTFRQVLLGFTACSSPYAPQGLVTGATYVFTVRAIGPAGNIDPTPAIRVFHYLASPRPNGDLDIRVTGIEVTQGIQASGCVCAGTLPSRDQANLMTPGQAAYQGVRMAAGHFTVVRVFANFTQPATLSSLQGATAQLEVLDSNGSRISLLNPDTAPPALTRPDCGACVSVKERASMGASFNFLVPWQETEHRMLSFRATVTPPVGLGLFAPRQCPSCHANTFLLSGVPFVSTANVPVHPIPLTVAGAQTAKSENQVFGSAQTVLPVNVQILPYDVPLAVDAKLPVTTVQASAAVAQRASDDHLDGTQYPIGVFIDGTAGLGGSTDIGKVLYGGAPPISIVRDDRPLSSAMHEIGHGLGLKHADTAPHMDGSPDCGGNLPPGMGELWPPDNKGRIQGVGLDRRNWDIYRTGSLPRTVVEGFPAAGTEYYDFMSYCPGKESAAQLEADHWISVRNWNRLLDFHPPPQTLAGAADVRARAASGASLRVIATVDPAGNASIFDVAPGQPTAAVPTTGSLYRIELRDAAGGLLASVVPATTTVHVDGHGSGLLLEATLPFVPTTASVVVSAGGRALASRARSPHAPTAAILSPRPGSHVGRASTTLLRFSARDADGDRLSATVDYSPDGGAHWKVVAGGVRGSSVRLRSRVLSASRNGRLRVRVSDGFNVTTAMSGRLTAAGAPPLVRIIGGLRGGRMRADATLLLQGEAYDDAGRQLTGRNLRWFAAGRLLGRGPRLTVQGLPANVRAIRLVATDAGGRSSQALLFLKVLAVRPTFLLARALTHVAPGARRVRILVASTVPAVLTIAGVRHAVDRRPRAITIVVRPGRSTLRLRYALSSRGGVTRGTYVAVR